MPEIDQSSNVTWRGTSGRYVNVGVLTTSCSVRFRRTVSVAGAWPTGADDLRVTGTAGSPGIVIAARCSRELLARMLAVVRPVAEGRVGDTPPDPHAVITSAVYTEPPFQIQGRRVTFSLQSCMGSCRIGSSESADTSKYSARAVPPTPFCR